MLVVVVTSEAGDGQLCKASSVRVGGRSLSLAVAERVITRGSDHTNCASLWYLQLGTVLTPTDNRVEVTWFEPVNQRAIGAYTLGNAPHGAPLATFSSTLNAGDGATIRTPVEIPDGGFAIDAVVGGADFTVPKALGAQITQFQILAPSSQAGASVLTDASARTMGWQFGQHFRSAHVVAVFGDVNLRVEGGTIVHDETPGDGVIDGDDQGDDVKGLAVLSTKVRTFVEAQTDDDPEVGDPLGVARKPGVVTVVTSTPADVTLQAGGNQFPYSTGLRTVGGIEVWAQQYTTGFGSGRDADRLAVVVGRAGNPLGSDSPVRRELVFLLVLEQDGTANYIQFQPLRHNVVPHISDDDPDNAVSFTVRMFAFVAGNPNGAGFYVTVQIEDDGPTASAGAIIVNVSPGIDPASDDVASVSDLSPAAQEAFASVSEREPLLVASKLAAIEYDRGADAFISLGDATAGLSLSTRLLPQILPLAPLYGQSTGENTTSAGLHWIYWEDNSLDPLLALVVEPDGERQRRRLSRTWPIDWPRPRHHGQHLRWR